ncbi:hypothetical protein V2J52_16495 [Georgenia sp. MJ173]|uniref:hypothetical protein n=1 Tax=Georgenia sunbinii TaxID=3117728 RepID=UPI002F26D42A
MLIIGAALTAFWTYERTVPDTFSREFSIALLGAVITLVPAAGLAALALLEQWRRAREIEILTRFAGETWQRRAIRAGWMEIPGIVVIASGNDHSEWTDKVDVEFTDWAAPRPLDDDVQQVVIARIPELIDRAARTHAPFTDDDCVDLVIARVELHRDAAGRRRPLYRLTPAPMTYFPFAATGAELDLPHGEGGMTLRHRFGPDIQNLPEVAALPVPAKVGSGTLVVSSDRRLVLGVRGSTMIAGRHESRDGRSLVHVVAEGATPDDVDRHGRFDPLVTARRGVLEEVGIGDSSEEVGRITKLVRTGFYLDQQRWQPCFANIAYVDLTWDEIQTAAPAAQHSWEVERYLSLPFDIAHPGVRRLLLDSHPDLALASNHAAAVLWFALLYEHGFTVMRDLLSRAVADDPPARPQP